MADEPTLGGFSFVKVIGIVILIAAGVAIMYVMLNYFGIGIPPIFVNLFWIVLVAAAGFLALYFLAILWSKLP